MLDQKAYEKGILSVFTSFLRQLLPVSFNQNITEFIHVMSLHLCLQMGSYTP